MRYGALHHPDGRRWHLAIPESRRERRRGLLGRNSIDPRAAMLFERCRSVHTIGMRFPITVVLLDGDLRVVAVRRLRPGRALLPRRGTRHVLECSVEARMEPGERLLLGEERPGELAGKPRDEDADGRGADHRERHDPANGAGKRDGLATAFGSPEAEDLEQRAHDSPSATQERSLSLGTREPRLYFRG
jgi:uncharacterized membrane protein (UPF0127 family)